MAPFDIGPVKITKIPETEDIPKSNQIPSTVTDGVLMPWMEMTETEIKLEGEPTMELPELELAATEEIENVEEEKEATMGPLSYLRSKVQQWYQAAEERRKYCFSKPSVYNISNYLTFGLVGMGKNLMDGNQVNWDRFNEEKNAYNLINWLSMGLVDVGHNYFTSKPGSKTWWDSLFGIGAIIFGAKGVRMGLKGKVPKGRPVPKETSGPDVSNPNIGIAQSRVNVANGRTRFTPTRGSTGKPVSAGFEHVYDQHFNRPIGNHRRIETDTAIS